MAFKEGSICLTGLPGCGKDRIKQLLLTQFGLADDSVGVDTECTASAQSQQLWCVIDIRSKLSEQDELAGELLAGLLQQADGVVFNFCEAAELDVQSYWSRWVRQHQPELPIVRVLNGRFPESWSGFEAKKVNRPDQVGQQTLSLADLQTFNFEVGTIYLDHLLMGLDNSKQNLGMQIWRVQAVIETFEYENLVAVEGTPYRWDTYAADEGAQPGWIKIQGFNLDQAWLNELVQASLLR